MARFKIIGTRPRFMAVDMEKQLLPADAAHFRPAAF